MLDQEARAYQELFLESIEIQDCGHNCVAAKCALLDIGKLVVRGEVSLADAQDEVSETFNGTRCLGRQLRENIANLCSEPILECGHELGERAVAGKWKS